MSEEIKLSKLQIWLGLIVFFVLSFGSLAYFFLSMWNTIFSIIDEKDIVMLSRGAFFCLGCGGALLLLNIDIFCNSVLNRPIDNKKHKILIKLLMVCVLLVFVMPIVGSFDFYKVLQVKQYKVCEYKTNSWPIYKTVVYTKNNGCELFFEGRFL